jgi:hypothetical protein
VWRGRQPDRSLIRIGDVVVSAFVREPHHLAIVGDHPLYGLSLIHSDGSAAKKVVEHGLSEQHLNQIVAIFRRPA